MTISHPGVAFDVRKLNVGDFTWVAREKTIPKPGKHDTHLKVSDSTEFCFLS